MNEHEQMISARLKAADAQKQNWIEIKTSLHKAIALACEGARVTFQQHGMTEADALANIANVLQMMTQGTMQRLDMLRPKPVANGQSEAAKGVNGH